MGFQLNHVLINDYLCKHVHCIGLILDKPEKEIGGYRKGLEKNYIIYRNRFILILVLEDKG